MGRREATGISGVLVVDKPAGMTSHDVVSRVRRATGERRVGHAGTLDPAATGVLVILIGPATRLAPHLTSAEKTYIARVAFGQATDTDDAEGEVVRSAPVPPALAEESTARPAVEQLVGEHSQVPPDYSAVKLGGVKAYQAARSGEPLALKPRTVTITDARLLAVDAGPPLTWDMVVTASKGTYVRAIARDLGDGLGTAAHLSSLRRSASGPLTLVDAHSLPELEEAGAHVARLFVDPVRALELPEVTADARMLTSVDSGSALPGIAEQGQRVAVVSPTHLLAIYEWNSQQGLYRALVVLPGGVARCE